MRIQPAQVETASHKLDHVRQNRVANDQKLLGLKISIFKRIVILHIVNYLLWRENNRFAQYVCVDFRRTGETWPSFLYFCVKPLVVHETVIYMV